MFNKNTYLLQQPYQKKYLLQQGSSPSFHTHSSTSLIGLNSEELFPHNHHHHDILSGSGHYLTSDPTMFNQDMVCINGDPSAMLNSSYQKTAAKKDRHSKIHTAQGPRDRRVRLSIGVARKFFDLQEMLGFDKPSKTLDWLLTKSKTAIKEVQTKVNNNDKGVINSSNSDECELEYSEEALFENGTSDSRGKKSVVDLAKESRVKARARARERTREKMCIKQLNESRNAVAAGGYHHHDLNPSNTNNIPIIQYMNNQLEVCKISGVSNSKNISAGVLHCPTSAYQEAEAVGGGDLIQESILIKRKMKHPSIFGFQPNNVMVNRSDLSSNYGVPSAYNNAGENWDMSNFASQSANLCAILEQHKFSNSSSNN